MKVLLVASTGGHFQAMQKLRLFWENHNCCWVTFRTPETQEILQDYPVYWAYAPTNRNIPNLWRNFVLAAQVLLKERPQLILSTGAGVAVPFIILGKLLGCQIVFVESFTRVEALSLSARVGKFLQKSYLDELPQFWNVLKEDMSLVATSPPTLDEIKAYDRNDWKRLAIRSGMTGAWRMGATKNLASFEEVIHQDITYIQSWKRGKDLQIILQTLFKIVRNFLGTKTGVDLKKTLPRQVQLLNITLDNLSRTELLHQIDRGFVVTPNVDHLIKLQKDPEFLRIYQLADYRICDSQILLLASKFLRTPIREKISGSDFFPAFCQYHRKHEDIRIFLLGGNPESVEIARQKINQRTGREIIVGVYSPPFGFDESEILSREIVDRITQCNPSVLAVGVGAPKQEKWIFRYKDCLPNVRIFLAIGSTIEFEAGTLQRAPEWMSKAGLEWLYRLWMEPQRLWKRYLIEDIPFFGLIILQKLGFYKTSVPQGSLVDIEPLDGNYIRN